MFDLIPFKRNRGLSKWFDDWEDSFLRDFFNDNFFTRGLTTFKTDIMDDGKNYVIEAELPGFSKDDISVEIRDNRLTISAKKDEIKDEKNNNFIRKERHVGEVTRSFWIDNVKEDQITATYQNGILKLVLPKENEDSPKARKIDIK